MTAESMSAFVVLLFSPLIALSLISPYWMTHLIKSDGVDASSYGTFTFGWSVLYFGIAMSIGHYGFGHLFLDPLGIDLGTSSGFVIFGAVVHPTLSLLWAVTGRYVYDETLRKGPLGEANAE